LTGLSKIISKVTEDKIDVSGIRDLVMAPNCGAVITFEGVVRNHDQGESVSAIYYEAYKDMAEKEIQNILQEALKLWPDIRLATVHRVGSLMVGEVSVVVVAGAPHRKEAFAAAKFVIDQVKILAPIWKKETKAGRALWKS